MTRRRQRTDPSSNMKATAPSYLAGHPLDVLSLSLARAEAVSFAVVDILNGDGDLTTEQRRRLQVLALIVDDHVGFARQALDALVQAGIEQAEREARQTAAPEATPCGRLRAPVSFSARRSQR